MIKVEGLQRAKDFAKGIFADRPKETPTDWAIKSIIFNEPRNHGPFKIEGRHYMREIIDAAADPTITHMRLVMGSQAGKTSAIMVIVAWLMLHRSTRAVWAMGNENQARSFSRNRWLTMIEASPALREILSRVRGRAKLLEQQIGSSIISFFGSNSPTNLSSTPAQLTIADEVDKFDEGGRSEADALNLLEQRTKGQDEPKHLASSTPTILDGIIWDELGKTDLRRRFIPCKGCGKFVVLAWSQVFTIFKLMGCEAFAVWDKEAKRKDGTWDLDRVDRSARYQCPFCGFHIQDRDRIAADEKGEWRKTRDQNDGYVGWHLPSFYSSASQCRVGQLARKFIKQAHSLKGLQGMINGDFAEPMAGQDTRQERVEIISNAIEVTAEWRKIMFVDCQAKAPFFWHVARAFNGGDSHGISSGSLDTWEEIRSKQVAIGVPDAAVCIDSGFGAKSESEVYVNCARWGQIVKKNDGRVASVGWMPSKGMPGRKRWKDPETDLFVPYYIRGIDPFVGRSEAGSMEIDLFEFSGDYYEDILENLRLGKGGYKWSVTQECGTEEYWAQMDARHKVAVRNKANGFTYHAWLPRREHLADHMKDCERGILAVANYFGWLQIEIQETT